MIASSSGRRGDWAPGGGGGWREAIGEERVLSAILGQGSGEGGAMELLDQQTPQQGLAGFPELIPGRRESKTGFRASADPHGPGAPQSEQV